MHVRKMYHQGAWEPYLSNRLLRFKKSSPFQKSSKELPVECARDSASMPLSNYSIEGHPSELPECPSSE